MILLAAWWVVTGADALLRGPAVEQVRRLGVPTLLTVGAFVGFGSALTGSASRVARPDPAALAGAGAGGRRRSPGRRAADGGLLHRGLHPLRFGGFRPWYGPGDHEREFRFYEEFSCLVVNSIDELPRRLLSGNAANKPYLLAHLNGAT